VQTTVAELGEHALIARITARLSMPAWVRVGPGDDAAVLVPQRGALQVLTMDAVVDGVHFDRRFVPPAAIGHRALAVNLSDLAAMGAQPHSALLSLMLPPALDVAEIDGLLDGVLGLADRFGVALVGGNITSTPGPLTLDITALGSVRPRRILTRSGARPGDEVFVTGTLGDAAVALEALRTDAGDLPDALRARYLTPEPRVRAGLILGRNRAATSCMDLSDGLADGLRQVAEASGVGMLVDAAAIPVSDAARLRLAAQGEDALQTALSAGDDYELLFTVRPAGRRRLEALRRQVGDLPLTRIGIVTKERGLVIREAAGTRELPAGFEHFR
jgi:thiamine-monophosphate kinase